MLVAGCFQSTFAEKKPWPSGRGFFLYGGGAGFVGNYKFRRRSRLSLLIAPATCIPSDDARAQDQLLSGRVGSARHAAGSGVACAPTLRREARRL